MVILLEPLACVVEEDTEEEVEEIPDPEQKIQNRKEVFNKNHYFDNEVVERLLHRYVKGACIDVKLRDEIMTYASELIYQIIKAHNLAQIYPGKDESSMMDLFQTAWLQIESALYKYEALPYCSRCYNNMRPNESLLCDEYTFEDELLRRVKRCPNCEEPLDINHIYYKGKSRVFNLYCINPNSKVITNNGIRNIGNILDCKNSIYGLDGLNNIKASIKKPKIETNIITIKLGYSLECTPEHSLYRLNNIGPEWTQSKDLHVGDLVGIQYSQQFFANNDDISDIILTKPGDRHEKFPLWQPPKKITPELAYFFGLYLAEGSYNSGMVSIYNQDKEVINFLINNKLNLKFTYNNKVSTYCCCQRFSEFLDKIGLSDCHLSHTKKIPNRLMGMSKENINALLRGLFDGDGHSTRHNGHIGYTSTSIELMEQIRLLLLNIGILSKIFKDDRKERIFKIKGVEYKSKLHGSWIILLSTIDSLLFYDRIGFNIERKQHNISKLSPPQQYLYGINKYFKSLYCNYGANNMRYMENTNYDVTRRARSGNRITVNTAIKTLKYWDKYSSDLNYKFIQDRINEITRFRNKIIWLPITKIIKSESEVCDIEVSSEDHSYIANGFISHNSQISRTVILAYIKKENRDRKNSDMFKTHVGNRPVGPSKIMERFVTEATEICKYNTEHLHILQCISKLHSKDEKAHEGLISKLMHETGYSRATITNFFKMIRLRGLEFSDSPLNEENNICRDSMEWEDDDHM